VASFDRNHWHGLTEIAKINPFTLNAKQIRAGVITKWLKTHNLREVQYVAGYCYINNTESYLQNGLQGLREEVQQFHSLG
jgi:integrase/recombinase XerD